MGPLDGSDEKEKCVWPYGGDAKGTALRKVRTLQIEEKRSGFQERRRGTTRVVSWEIPSRGHKLVRTKNS